MQIPVLNGIYTDADADFRTSYPRNLVPVPKQTGIAQGYMRPADGIAAFGVGPGLDRGGINWNGQMYRVMGSKLVRVSQDGTVYVLGYVGDGGQVTLDYSFDRLAIASAGKLWYWDGTTLAQVTDPDLGTVVDMRWIAGYFLCTDGTSLIVTELNDPFSVNPLKYGSAESDPDPIVGVDEMRNEAYALGRYTIEVFQNVGGDNFPFQRIEGAEVSRGIIGTHAYCQYLSTFAFVGSGRNEAPAVWLMVPGDTDKLSTREIDQVLATYSEEQLAAVVVEARVDKGHQLLLVHLPDRCLVFDGAATKAVGEPVWFTLDSGLVEPATYRARGLVWCYDQWNVGDPTSTSLGRLVSDTSAHFGTVIGWDFGTVIVYNDGKGAIIHDIELVALTGRAVDGTQPVVWTSYSEDGVTWSQEKAANAGMRGNRNQRICWRRQGRLRNWRIQRFRGTSDAHLTLARLEAQIEALYG